MDPIWLLPLFLCIALAFCIGVFWAAGRKSRPNPSSADYIRWQHGLPTEAEEAMDRAFKQMDGAFAEMDKAFDLARRSQPPCPPTRDGIA